MEIMSWALSATSGLMLWLMGNKSKWGPVVGLTNQVLWVVYTVITKQWGLLPGVVLYAAIHARNLYRWKHEQLERRAG